MAKRIEPEPAPDASPDVIHVTAARDGIYCCGVVHIAAPRDFPRDHFTAAQLQELRAHPELTVEAAD